jgi:RNA polymerase sigma-70 factor, ECF subfamily
MGPDAMLRALAEQVAARAGWRVDLDGFVDFLTQCAGPQRVEGEPLDAASAFGLHVDDLYLAYGCAVGEPRARQTFATIHLGVVDERLRRFRFGSSDAEEVRRKVEDLLLFGREGGPPRIAQYKGRGPLRAFVAAVAVNVARSWLRTQQHRRDVELDDVTSALLRPPDESREAASPEYSELLREALRATVALLEQRQRTIVRLHLTRGVPQVKIAKMLGVNQSTVSRTLEAALYSLQTGIRRRLQERGLRDDEITSIVRDVRHAIDISLSRVLAASEAS